MKTFGIALVIAGIVGLIAGVCAYVFLTETVQIDTMPITIEKATYYTGQTSAGFWGPKEAYYSQIQVEPTATAKPNVDYLITTNNGIIKDTYSVSWSQVELAISKAKTITDRISQDDLTALKQNSQYTVTINERKPQHNIIYIVPGILIFALGVVLLLIRVPPPPPDEPKIIDETLKHFYDKHTNPKSTNKAASEQRDKTTEVNHNPSPSGSTIFIDPEGKPTPPLNEDEPITFIEHGDTTEFYNSQSSFGQLSDILTNQKINRLVEKGDITIREADAIRQQTKNMDPIQKQSFLSAIERRGKTNRG